MDFAKGPAGHVAPPLRALAKYSRHRLRVPRELDPAPADRRQEALENLDQPTLERNLTQPAVPTAPGAAGGRVWEVTSS